MGTIVRFHPPAPGQRRTAREAARAGQILMFTGIRYDRSTQPHEAKAKRVSPPKRKGL